MNQADIIDAVATQTNESKSTVKSVLDALGVVTASTLRDGDEVTLPGLGKFKASVRKARTGRNPSTGAPLEIPAKTAATFTASKGLKDALNG